MWINLPRSKEEGRRKTEGKDWNNLTCVPAQLCGLAGRTCIYSHWKDNRIHKTNQYSVIHGMIHGQDIAYVVTVISISFHRDAQTWEDLKQ